MHESINPPNYSQREIQARLDDTRTNTEAYLNTLIPLYRLTGIVQKIADKRELGKRATTRLIAAIGLGLSSYIPHDSGSPARYLKQEWIEIATTKMSGASDESLYQRLANIGIENNIPEAKSIVLEALCKLFEEEKDRTAARERTATTVKK